VLERGHALLLAIALFGARAVEFALRFAARVGFRHAAAHLVGDGDLDVAGEFVVDAGIDRVFVEDAEELVEQAA